MANDREIFKEEKFNQNNDYLEEHTLLVTNVRSLNEPPSPVPNVKKLPLREAKNNANKALSSAANPQSDGTTSESENSMAKPVKLGPEKFGCPFCSSKMTDWTGMKRHIMTHTGEKPFSCDYCEKRFIMRNHLTRHRMIHTGEQPYSCEHCGKSFNRKDHLAKHRLIHN